VLILALDTCDSNGSVAVLRDAQVLQTLTHESSEDYSSWLLNAVTELLRAAGLSLSEIDAYAVAAGPGSFTGVRVALTTAKAWAEVYARGVAVVSRLEALAAQAAAAKRVWRPWPTPVAGKSSLRFIPGQRADWSGLAMRWSLLRGRSSLGPSSSLGQTRFAGFRPTPVA